MNRGFTLIEIIVVVAIVSILAGTLFPLFPFIYRVWENTAIESTYERLINLRKAIVGDPVLIQNGVRIDYSYVGDCGQLPSTLEKLVTADLMECPDWHGPYLSSGFNDNYNKDAWGEEFIYNSESATLISKGPDRIQSSADDISIVISSNEIIEAAPVNEIKGNIDFSFYNLSPNPVTPQYYSKVTELLYNQGTNCMRLDIGSINTGETISFVQAFNFSLSNPLRKGKVVTIRYLLFKDDPSCNINNIASRDMNIFVGSMTQELLLNMSFPYTIQ